MAQNKRGDHYATGRKRFFMPNPALKRGVTLPFLIFYGVGTIVGGGFYALMGEVVALIDKTPPLVTSARAH